MNVAVDVVIVSVALSHFVACSFFGCEERTASTAFFFSSHTFSSPAALISVGPLSLDGWIPECRDLWMPSVPNFWRSLPNAACVSWIPFLDMPYLFRGYIEFNDYQSQSCSQSRLNCGIMRNRMISLPSEYPTTKLYDVLWRQRSFDKDWSAIICPLLPSQVREDVGW